MYAGDMVECVLFGEVSVRDDVFVPKFGEK